MELCSKQKRLYKANAVVNVRLGYVSTICFDSSFAHSLYKLHEVSEMLSFCCFSFTCGPAHPKTISAKFKSSKCGGQAILCSPPITLLLLGHKAPI